MEYLRRTWHVALLLIGSLGIAISAVTADLTTLRQASAPAAEAARYLCADALVSVASALALVALLTGRSWAPSVMLGWMVVLVVVLAWILFIAVGNNGPPLALRIGFWFACALLSGIGVQRVRRVWASEGRNAAA